ncbi:TetR/AcrR family transcriptional regulator [Paraconexibacter sp. AEG42_29]
MPRPAAGETPTYEKILEVAAELFYTRGFNAVGVDQIGAGAGISGPAIYRHFAGKDEILATLFEHAIDDVLVETASEFDDPHEALEHHVRAHATYAMRDRRMAAILIHEGRSLADPYRRRLDRRQADYVAGFAAKVEACYPDAKSRSLPATWAAVATLNSIAITPHSVDQQDVMELLVLFVIEGFKVLVPTGGRAPAKKRARSAG